MLRPLAPLLLVLALAFPAAAGAARGSGDDGQREAHATGSCGRGASAELRLRARDGAIELEFRLQGRRAGEAWRTVVSHERRVALRRTLRTSRTSRSARLRTRLDDYGGADGISVRAAGPAGVVCTAAATLPG